MGVRMKTWGLVPGGLAVSSFAWHAYSACMTVMPHHRRREAQGRRGRTKLSALLSHRVSGPGMALCPLSRD